MLLYALVQLSVAAPAPSVATAPALVQVPDARTRRRQPEHVSLLERTQGALSEGNASDALAAALERVAATPDVSALVHLGEAYRLAGKTQRAADAFAAAMDVDARDPTCAYALANLADFAVTRGELYEAHVLYTRASTYLDPVVTPFAHERADWAISEARGRLATN